RGCRACRQIESGHGYSRGQCPVAILGQRRGAGHRARPRHVHLRPHIGRGRNLRRIVSCACRRCGRCPCQSRTRQRRPARVRRVHVIGPSVCIRTSCCRRAI